MARRSFLGWLGIAAACGVVAVTLLSLRHSRPQTIHHKSVIEDGLTNIPKPKEADRLYATNPKAAAPQYKAFIAKFASAKEPIIQDQVGTARLKVGFLAAHQKDWSAARQAFLAADKSTKGTGRTGDFGTINDQGAYEAIVCLEATGKKDEAKKQYNDFIHDRELSPLCMACYRRIKRLSSGETTPELDKLIDGATKKQDVNAKFEASVCGPKTLEYALKSGLIHADKSGLDYKALARLCHTTETGTTMAGMIDGLKFLGIKASAFQISRRDLSKLKTPAIVLWGSHYLTLLEVKDRSIRAYDTRTRSEQDFPIPDLDDPDFCLDTIIL